MKVIKDKYKKFSLEVACCRCCSDIKIECFDDLIATGCIPNQNGKHDYVWYCPCCNQCNEIDI